MRFNSKLTFLQETSTEHDLLKEPVKNLLRKALQYGKNPTNKRYHITMKKATKSYPLSDDELYR